jgi:hypothetical protein
MKKIILSGIHIAIVFSFLSAIITGCNKNEDFAVDESKKYVSAKYSHSALIDSLSSASYAIITETQNSTELIPTASSVNPYDSEIGSLLGQFETLGSSANNLLDPTNDSNTASNIIDKIHEFGSYENLSLIDILPYFSTDFSTVLNNLVADNKLTSLEKDVILLHYETLLEVKETFDHDYEKGSFAANEISKSFENQIINSSLSESSKEKILSAISIVKTDFPYGGDVNDEPLMTPIIWWIIRIVMAIILWLI